MEKVEEGNDNNVESIHVESMFSKNESILNLWDQDVLYRKKSIE